MSLTVNTYKVRSGPAIPVVGKGTTSKAITIFTFGVERQEVISQCASEVDFLTSKDMCLMGGDYFSANYRAFPGKIDGKLYFTAVLTKKPVKTNETTVGGCTGGSTGGGIAG
jgi:hypothetical protein